MTDQEIGALIAVIGLYNSFFDLILQMLLGYGMVVLLLEDVSRAGTSPDV